MTNKHVVRLTIQVPADVEVVPVVVRKPGMSSPNPSSARYTKEIQYDLTTAKATSWLNSSLPRFDQCCCVRGIIMKV